MKYLMHHSCISDSDVTKILKAMEPQVKSWRVGGKTESSKQKNREAFGKCIKRSLRTDRSGENELKCKVIEVIKEVKIIQDKKLEGINSGAGSGTCSTASNTHNGSKYVNDCSGGASTTTTTTTTNTRTTSLKNL
ncbi:SICAvar, type I (fragment) [Plasmodium knowlesi strain H]|uniref:SICAvar, type I n=2 Tax=Plasmodium knowlesi (strain H) TaxID=5851 RepID=A0A1A7W2W3_PLAKH